MLATTTTTKQIRLHNNLIDKEKMEEGRVVCVRFIHKIGIHMNLISFKN